jgi:Flp pilus assembly protein TadD
LRAYVVLGQRHRAAGRLDAALELYERAVERAPGHAPFWLEKGVTLWEMGRSREAERCFRRAVELAPDLAQAWMNLGVVLAERGETAPAEVALRKALLHQPYLTGAAVLLGDLAYRDGRFDEAARFYEGCVALGREEIRPRLEAARRMSTAGRGDRFAR